MKIRLSAVAVSSVLFTVAFLLLTPRMIDWALATHQSRFRDRAFYPEPGIAWDQVVIPNYYAPLGITSLAIIAIGLLVTWAGYAKGLRWTWFVMFVIVWVWTFPIWVLPIHPWTDISLFGPTLASALREAGMARDAVEALLAFVLMVLALVLPARTFIMGPEGRSETSGRTRPRTQETR